MPRDFGPNKRIEILEDRVDGLENALFTLIKKVDKKFPTKPDKGKTILGIKT